MAKDDILRAPKIKWMVEPIFYQDPETGEVRQISAGIDEHGREVGDPRPMAVPAGLAVSNRDMVHDAIRQMMRSEAFAAAMDAEGFDTPDEADDFEIDDDPLDPYTPWEQDFLDAQSRRAAKEKKLMDDAAAAAAPPSPTPTAPAAEVGRGEGGARPEPAPPTPAAPQAQSPKGT